MKKLVEKLLNWCKKSMKMRICVGKVRIRKECCLQWLWKRWAKLFFQRLSRQLVWQKLSMKGGFWQIGAQETGEYAGGLAVLFDRTV